MWRKTLSLALVAAFVSLMFAPWSAATARAQDVAAARRQSQASAQRQAAGVALDSEEFHARLAAAEKVIEEKRQELGIPGMALAVVKDDRVVLLKGYGVKDFERKLPVTPDTLFAIGSSSKAFTALTVMLGVDEGKLSLEDSPKKYLPYFRMRDPETDAKITVRDLLSHSSGLNRTDIPWVTGTLNREEVIRVAGLAKPTAKLREKFQYQNVMYSAAGEVAAKVHGKKWEDVVRERIFRPLGMKGSNLTVDETLKAPDYSLGYEYDDDTKETRRRPMRDFPQVAAAGAINSSARDMAQWLRLMTGGGTFDGQRLVSEKSFAELLTPQTKISPDGRISYGLGWFLREWRGHKVAEHGGNIDGFNALVALMPEQKLGFVMLTNVSGSPLGATAMEAVWSNLVGSPDKPATPATPAVAGNGAQPQPSPAAAVTPATPATPSGATAEYAGPLKEVIGTYSFRNFTGEVALRGGKVYMVVAGQPPYELVERAKDTYSLTGLPETYSLTVKRDAAGKPVALAMKQPEVEFEMTRVPEFKAPLTVEELMAKHVEALGGEASMRKHKSMRIEIEADMEHQGVTAEGFVYAKAPNMISTNVTLMALGKKIGTSHDFFDGTAGGEEASFLAFSPTTGKELENLRIGADFYGPLNWRRNYQKVVITKLAKVGDEEAYVVVKTPEKGYPVTDYISTKSFLLLRQDTLAELPGGATLPVTERFSDYRNVDGLMIPFMSVSSNIGSGDTIMRVKEVKFDVEIPDAEFKRQTK
ncbi:MAG TPA: serine hydrolase [Pyrinomonadaceae bacterium]|nr:serine hydrolase [Pyrinomonadaceae bacterium]